MASSGRLFQRGGPLPPRHFSVGSDVYLAPFGEFVSLRRYDSFGSERLYPSNHGRMFSLDHFKLILKLAVRVSAALDRGVAHLFQSPHFKISIVPSTPRRCVVFQLDGRDDFALSRPQWNRLIECGHAFVHQTSKSSSLMPNSGVETAMSKAAVTDGPTKKPRGGGRKKKEPDDPITVVTVNDDGDVLYEAVENMPPPLPPPKKGGRKKAPSMPPPTLSPPHSSKHSTKEDEEESTDDEAPKAQPETHPKEIPQSQEVVDDWLESQVF